MATPAAGGKGGDEPGMTRAELKTHMRLAGTDGLPFAFALGADGAAVLRLHKSKGSPILFQQMKKAVPDGKRHTHGTVSFDPVSKTAVFSLEKAVSGISRSLVKALKGTGAAKVKVLVDGTEVEVHEEPDGEIDVDVETAGHGQGGQHGQHGHGTEPPKAGANGQASHPIDPQIPVAPRAHPTDGKQGAQPDGQPDARALNASLTGLVKRMLEVVKRDPAQKAELTELAVQAKKSLDGGDLGTAKADIEVFGMALDAAAGAAPQQAGGNGLGNGQANGQGNGQASAHDGGKNGRPPPITQGEDGAKPHGASHPAAPKIDKARSAWLATRQQIERQIEALAKQFEAAFTDHEMADEIAASFKARVESVLHHLDEALSHKLAEVNKAHDAASRAKLVDDAHKLIAKYSQHISSDATIKELDDNPFVPMQLAKTLTTTLSTLSKSIH